tara:strand:+ start:7472 stop:7573 length:102 start_codon:yes stop_codon:yes gene_type:complete
MSFLEAAEVREAFARLMQGEALDADDTASGTQS